jgi:hypothetical protein
MRSSPDPSRQDKFGNLMYDIEEDQKVSVARAVRGRDAWLTCKTLWAVQDAGRFPHFQQARPISCVQEAGETIFVPRYEALLSNSPRSRSLV